MTQEEARMAAAENLRLTHSVEKKVEGVADTVVAIDNRVTGVDERVAGVDDRVAGVDEHVADVIDQVAGVDERVAGVDDRVQRAANDVDEIKRLLFLNLTIPDYRALPTHPFRESITGEHSQMALSIGPLYEPQHRM